MKQRSVNKSGENDFFALKAVGDPTSARKVQINV